MHPSIRTNSDTLPRGFALSAMVLISSITLVISLAAIQVAFAYRGLLDVQYYYGLAREAAQAGTVYAAACYKLRGADVQTLSPLRPNTNCTIGTSGNDFVTKTGNITTTFSVAVTVSTTPLGEVMRAVATGTTTLTNSSGATVRTYQQNMTRSYGTGTSKEQDTVTGDRYSIFTLTSTKDAYGFGKNDFGQLGNGTTDDSTTPSKFNLPVGLAAKQVYKEDDTTFVLASDGQVYAAGNNTYGGLGNGSPGPFPEPQLTPAKFILPGSLTAKYMMTDGDVGYVIASDGNLYVAGRNNYGQLGNGSTTSVSTPIKYDLSAIAPGVSAIKVAADSSMTMVLGSDGNVYTSGRNHHGQLGQGFKSASGVLVPGKYRLPVGVTAVDIGCDDVGISQVLGSDGNVYGFGFNNVGQLGVGNTNEVISAAGQAMLPGGITATSLEVGDTSSYVIGSDGNVYGMGNNASGQLGDGTRGDAYGNAPLPVKMDLKAGVKAISLNSEDAQVVVVGDDGKAYGAGRNLNGQLGDGTTHSPQSTPVEFQLPSGIYAKNAVSDGFATFVLGSDGNLYGAGRNTVGYIDGNVSNAGANITTPVVFPLPTGIKASVSVSPVIIL